MALTPEEVFQQQPHLWTRLDRLRRIFLDREKKMGGAEVYWADSLDLLAYDLSFARRIANKWDNVLSRLPKEELLRWGKMEWVDWGCGSAVASESLLRFLGPPQKIWLWDHSLEARSFARQKLLSLGVHSVSEMKDPLSGFAGKLVLLSHLVNELPEGVLSALLASLKEAAAIVWVDAGSRETSQKLSRCRDRLLAMQDSFRILLPCPHHNAKCPLSGEGVTDWCHFFADVDPEFHQSAFWREFSERVGVDLRSLPFSVLVMQQEASTNQSKSEAPSASSTFRVLGAPRVYKGFLKVQACHGLEGVKEYILEKRSDKSLFKRLKDPPALALHEWQLNDGKDKILSGSEVGRKKRDGMASDDTE